MDAMDVTDEDVYCDKTRLNQILLNLLSNAIKFTPAGGTVSVRVRQLAGKVHGCGQYEFRIKDTGIEVTRQIRSLHDDTPIIILTAYDWSDIEVEAKAAGVTAFCSKPIVIGDLVQELHKIL